MIKLKRLLCLLLFLFPGSLFACSCAYEGVTNNFQASEFVAKAKIIKITPDPTNSNYHDAIIESAIRQPISMPTAYGITALSVANTPPIGRPNPICASGIKALCTLTGNRLASSICFLADCSIN